MTSVRKNAVEGMFYTSSSAALRDTIQRYLDASEKVSKKAVKFIVVPHAGYTYSGRIAGAAFKEIDPDAFDHIMLLGPSHRHYFKGLAESTENIWQTPLGEVPISHLNSPDVIRSSKYHQNEHCLEVQLPFIKFLMPQARVTPLLLSGDRSKAAAIAEMLLPYDSRQTLWVISSDLNHTGPGFRHIPREVGYASGKSMDHDAIQFITDGNIKGFSTFLRKTDSSICGALPILVAMHLIRTMNRANFSFKAYDCSGDQTGDDNSVGYGALYA